ncbi:hypothetical protein AB833_16905 [Chromatiales bacterium (ex Bugula neritina AB1)]|nr:hypothetical protein AB833_16905 [Chromatiales bacterium (ex Bugula neritina AB1)]
MLPPVSNPASRVAAPLAIEKKFNPLNFAIETLKRPSLTGAIAPSSSFVARRVVELADISDSKTVVELGPGTGVFTTQILKSISPATDFFALEVNEAFADATRNRCPQARVYHDSATKLSHYLNVNSFGLCDCIITSLPWTIFNPHEQEQLLETISASLKPGGRFISIVYAGAKMRERGRYYINSLPLFFSTVHKTHTVWQNLPPTRIYCCSK